MKKKFTVPLVFLTTASPMEDGGRTGQGWVDSIKPIPVSFAEWAQSRWCADYDNNGGVDFLDYAKWWAQAGLGAEAWNQYNSDVAWDDEWTK